MSGDFDDTSGTELAAVEEALLREMPTLSDVGQTAAGGLGAFALMLLE